jgi:hypothetical protein
MGGRVARMMTGKATALPEARRCPGVMPTARCKPTVAAWQDNWGMFQPSQHDVRRFFCEVWRRHRHGLPMEPMQTQALPWVVEHPEYDDDLKDVERALQVSYRVEDGRSNPFLHLSMHLSIAEQCSIDQPAGIRQAVTLLAARRASLHAAHHEVMECLGDMLWTSQRNGRPPDGFAYLEAVRRRAGAGGVGETQGAGG